MGNEGLGWDSLLKMVYNGGDWHPVRGPYPRYHCVPTKDFPCFSKCQDSHPGATRLLHKLSIGAVVAESLPFDFRGSSFPTKWAFRADVNGVMGLL